jgi:outer membrane lipoprotein-sorting protein
MITDVRLRQSAEISFVEKQVWLKQLDDKQLRHCQNPVAAMLKIVSNEADLLREEKIAGRVAQVYRVKKLDFLFQDEPQGEKESAALWVDRETRLPVRIELKTASADDQAGEIVFDEFVWNESLDAALFSLTPPPGFAVKRGGDNETP